METVIEWWWGIAGLNYGIINPCISPMETVARWWWVISILVAYITHVRPPDWMGDGWKKLILINGCVALATFIAFNPREPLFSEYTINTVE